jgi:hypothetical protein
MGKITIHCGRGKVLRYSDVGLGTVFPDGSLSLATPKGDVRLSVDLVEAILKTCRSSIEDAVVSWRAQEEGACPACGAELVVTYGDDVFAIEKPEQAVRLAESAKKPA